MSISAAHPRQRFKVKDEVCIVCGRGPEQEKIDAAHLWDRSRGGCDDMDCVVPLCRRHHREYDEKKLDILGALIAAGLWHEMGHPIIRHQVSPSRLTARLTGEGLDGT